MGREDNDSGLNDLVYLRALNDRHVSEAADVIEAQAKRIAELEAALKDIIADMNGIRNPLINVRAISVGALNAARKVLGEKE